MKTEMFAIVNEIPFGKVVSYGDVAEQLCMRHDANTSGWLVGRLLSSMSYSERDMCPWRRVVNKQGLISTLKLGERGIEQIKLLEKENIEVDGWEIDIKKYLYKF
jgi:alkylated DNA nucleotide flippase Atl1